jgi:hypothetical protein
LTFTIESAETAFEALARLAFGQSKEELLEDARFDKDGKLRGVELDWRKRGNAKIPSWDNTILGHIKISGRSLVVELNSENRARRFRAEVEKRLGSSAKHESTTAQTIDEMRAKTPKRSKAQARKHDEFIAALLRDPEARNRIQDTIQKQTEDWVRQKIPVLGGRTPLEAVQDPDGREIVESLLLDWERRADAGAYQPGLRPDFAPLKKLLGLRSPTP